MSYVKISTVAGCSTIRTFKIEQVKWLFISLFNENSESFCELRVAE